MSMLLWLDESQDQAIDLGDPISVWSSFAEMAKAAPGEDWPELYGVPHAAEQEVSAEWLAAVREQATRFLEQHGGELSDGTEALLMQLSGQDREEAVESVAPRRQHKKTIKRDDDGNIVEIVEEEVLVPAVEAKDATGHEHKGKGEGGGQFTAGSAGGTPASVAGDAPQGQDNSKAHGRSLVADKHPWQMTRAEWEQSGRPEPKNLEDTIEAEKQAVNDFFRLFPNPVESARSGEIEPHPSTYAKTRDDSFAPGGKAPAAPLKSKLPIPSRLKKAGVSTPGEDARYAILYGRKLGYRDEDIAHYLVYNYVPSGETILSTGKVPTSVARDFPSLRGDG